MSITSSEVTSVQQIVMSNEAALYLRSRGQEIDPKTPHFEACITAETYSDEGAELLENDLKAVQAGESFAYVVSMPNGMVDSLAPEVRANIGRVSNLSFVRVLGKLGTSSYEEDGALLSLVTPAEGYEHTQSYRGSEDPLLFHQEMLPKPDDTSLRDALTRFVILHSVSDTTPATPTMASPIRPALDLLSKEDIAVLKEPIYKLRPYDAMQLTGSGVVEEENPEPIIHPDGLVIADFADIETASPEAAKAFQNFLMAANEVAVPVTLGPGKTLVVDNHEAFHGRGSIPSGRGRRMLIRAHVL